MSQASVTKRQTSGYLEVNSTRMFGKLPLLTCVYCVGARNPDLLGAKREWASMAREHLAAVTHAVDELRGLFLGTRDALRSWRCGRSRCAGSLQQAQRLAPKRARAERIRVAGGELGAAGGVYRNAAVAFKSLAEVEGGQRQARSRACATLLGQGDHHVEILRSLSRVPGRSCRPCSRPGSRSRSSSRTGPAPGSTWPRSNGVAGRAGRPGGLRGLRARLRPGRASRPPWLPRSWPTRSTWWPWPASGP